eukprot:2886355-Amphidinium_carterae.1
MIANASSQAAKFCTSRLFVQVKYSSVLQAKDAFTHVDSTVISSAAKKVPLLMRSYNLAAQQHRATRRNTPTTNCPS